MNKGITRITRSYLQRWPLPDASAIKSKEQRGVALVIAGSRQVPGAAALAAIAAFRAGVGKLQVATVTSIAATMGISIPEAGVIRLSEDRSGEVATGSRALRSAAKAADAILIGPGQKQTVALSALVRSLSALVGCPVVLDAGAIPPRPVSSSCPTLLTPHAGEMASLLGEDLAKINGNPIEAARYAARTFDSIVALKGPTTYIATPDGELWSNTVHCPGLGTSGSGDVLAGIVTGLLARGAAPTQALVWGVWLHGQAGKRCASRSGPIGFLAREISAEIPGLL